MRLRNAFSIILSCFIAQSNAADAVGTLKGFVKYDGEAPEAGIKEIPPSKQAACKHGTSVSDESLVVEKSTKGLKWAVVRIMNVKSSDAPRVPDVAPKLDQKGCVFTPHVIVVAPNTDLQILNPDGVLHNIHTLPGNSGDPAQNYPHMPTEPVKLYKGAWLKEPDILEIRCDMHQWMKGFIVVHDPRFCAITGADGAFEIRDVPVGKYTVSIFQESCGDRNLDVVIKAGAATDLGEVKLALKKKTSQ